MLAVLLIGLVLVGSAVAGTVPQAVPLVGYHDAVGIPHAAKIKAMEEEYFARNDDAVNPGTVNPRIIGGVVAGANAHPHLGGLVVNFVGLVGQSACGSSLLTANRLVTAAHCWNDGRRQASQFEVVLGTSWLFFGGTRIVTNQVFMHPSWNPSTLANDIAMIYLPTNVVFSAAIRPVALPSTTQLWNSFENEWAVAAGYGITSDLQTGVSTATVVSHVALQVISVAQCQATYGHRALDSNICTSGDGGVGICGGDSGGPLTIFSNGQNILVGVSSFAAEIGCQQGRPSGFARVTSFYGFIIGHIL